MRFLHQHFSTKHPRILGQTPQDVMKNKEIFETVCPDDEILQSCLQIRNSGRLVVNYFLFYLCIIKYIIGVIIS